MSSYTAEQLGEAVFDELSAAVRLTIAQLAERTGRSRGQVATGIRWLRDTLGDEALVTNRDNTYELALQAQAVADYRIRRLSFIAASLRRLGRVLEAGITKFGEDPDEVVAVEMLKAALSALTRATAKERVRL